MHTKTRTNHRSRDEYDGSQDQGSQIQELRQMFQDQTETIQAHLEAHTETMDETMASHFEAIENQLNRNRVDKTHVIDSAQKSQKTSIREGARTRNSIRNETGKLNEKNVLTEQTATELAQIRGEIRKLQGHVQRLTAVLKESSLVTVTRLADVVIFLSLGVYRR